MTETRGLLSEGKPDGMETTAEERASMVAHTERWSQGASFYTPLVLALLRDFDRLLAREAKAREEEREAIAQWHDEEVKACYRRLASPDSYDNAEVWNTRAKENERSAAAIRARSKP